MEEVTMELSITPLHAAHVAHVKQPRCTSDSHMFCLQPGILDGHGITGEWHHACTCCRMCLIQRGNGQFHGDFFHASKVARYTACNRRMTTELSPVLPPVHHLSCVNRNVIIADRAVTAMERIIKQLQGASLIGAEKAKDEMLGRIRTLGRNAMPADARKARFDTIPGDIFSILAHNHRIYYLVEDARVVVLDVILDAEIHSVESDG